MTKGRGKNPGASNLNKHIKRKEHKERAQPAARRKLGQLEKHKDYVIRARKRRERVSRLTQLKRAAAQRNPDEFHIGMTQAVMDVASGRMKRKQQRQSKAQRAKELVGTIRNNRTNVRYLEFKAQSDVHRVKELLQEDSSIALTATAPKNKHVVFVESEDELKHFNALKYFDVTSQMLKQHPAVRGTLSVMKKTNLPEELLLGGYHVKSTSQRRKERQALQEKLARSEATEPGDRQAIVDHWKAKRDMKQYRFTDLVSSPGAAAAVGRDDAQTEHLRHSDKEESMAGNDEDEEDDATRMLRWRREEEQRQALDAARRAKEITQRAERSRSLNALAKTIRRQNGGIKKQLDQRSASRFKPNAVRRAR